MSETGSIVIAGRREEDLCLVLEAPKRFAVDDPIAIPLKGRPHVIFRLRPETSARFRAFGRLWREHRALTRFELIAYRHDRPRTINAELAARAQNTNSAVSAASALHVGL
jgi:hypothetical protein